MATLEDKILGEKLHNYCSSSEESGNESDSDSEGPKQQQDVEQAPSLPEPNKWEGTSTNTGPKGVLKDWQRFKQLETEQRAANERERVELVKKLSMTVRSALDEEREKAELEEDPDLAEMLNDCFLLEYQKKRMQEMLEHANHTVKFGVLQFLRNADEYLDAIDKEDKAVKVVIHFYEQHVEACKAMNAALEVVSRVYDTVKFCSIVSSTAGLSRDFKRNGVPALLVYKGGQVVGNFVRISDDLGNDFDAEDLQNYLVEHGMLEDKSCTPLIVRKQEEEDDSD